MKREFFKFLYKIQEFYPEEISLSKEEYIILENLLFNKTNNKVSFKNEKKDFKSYNANTIDKSSFIYNNIEDLYNKYKNCSLCYLKDYRKNIIFGKGKLSPDIMLIYEKPSEEDSRNPDKLFINDRGRIILAFLKSEGINTKNMFITPFIKCFAEKEIKESVYYSCLEIIKEEIKIINPKLILTFGANIGTTLLKEVGIIDSIDYPISELRLREFSFLNIPMLITYDYNLILTNKRIYNYFKLKDLPFIGEVYRKVLGSSI